MRLEIYNFFKNFLGIVFWRSLLVFDACLTELPSKLNCECYLSWPEALLDFIVCLRCLIVMLFVVAGVHLAFIELPSEIEFECYLSWPDIFWRSLLAFRILF